MNNWLKVFVLLVAVFSCGPGKAQTDCYPLDVIFESPNYITLRNKIGISLLSDGFVLLSERQMPNGASLIKDNAKLYKTTYTKNYQKGPYRVEYRYAEPSNPSFEYVEITFPGVAERDRFVETYRNFFKDFSDIAIEQHGDTFQVMEPGDVCPFVTYRVKDNRVKFEFFTGSLKFE